MSLSGILALAALSFSLAKHQNEYDPARYGYTVKCQEDIRGYGCNDKPPKDDPYTTTEEPEGTSMNPIFFETTKEPFPVLPVVGGVVGAGVVAAGIGLIASAIIKKNKAAETTLAPFTDAPFTSVTYAPVTDAPLTPATTEPQMVSLMPSSAPVTYAPVTAAPAPMIPVTYAPVTAAPAPVMPVTDASVTYAPVTAPPAPVIPVTDATVTSAPYRILDMNAIQQKDSLRGTGKATAANNAAGTLSFPMAVVAVSVSVLALIAIGMYAAYRTGGRRKVQNTNVMLTTSEYSQVTHEVQ